MITQYKVYSPNKIYFVNSYKEALNIKDWYMIIPVEK